MNPAAVCDLAMGTNLQSSRNIARAGSTRDRLIAAVIVLWGRSPGSEISVRALAREAQAAVSAIDYHFSGLGRLYAQAQSYALSRAQEWAEARLVQVSVLKGPELNTSIRASVIAAIIDDWTETQRPLAMAWREACSMARRGNDQSSHANWCALWRRFWKQVSAILGIPRRGDLLAAFHDGEATQHLLRWSRALDRSLLDETVNALLAHLEGGHRWPACVRPAYQELAYREYGSVSEQEGQVSHPLDVSAAEILRESGISALTFRGVAERGGATLGGVSYHFGSKSRMLKRAFEQLYRLAVGTEEELGRLSGKEILEATVEALAAGNQPVLSAFDEIILHISRSEDHLALRGLIRGHRDPVASWALEGLLGSREPIPSSLAAAYASINRGVEHLTLSLETAESRDLTQKIILGFLNIQPVS